MANLVYKRVPTDQQSTDRQNLVLDAAGIEAPVVFEEQAGTSSRLHPLERPKFGELLAYARPGDAVHISEMFRLVRGTGHTLDVFDVLHRDRLTLRIHDGAFSAMDLTARHPRTGELLSTVKFMVQTLAAGELQRDLQRELTYDRLRAAEANGNKGGRRPAVPATKADDVRTAYLEGRSVAVLARDHGVSRGVIRSAVADLLPEYTAVDPGAPAPELAVPPPTCWARSPTSSAPPNWSPPSAPHSPRASPCDAARAAPCASPPSSRSTGDSSISARSSTAPRRSRSGARPAASTRTASAHSRLPARGELTDHHTAKIKNSLAPANPPTRGLS
ncbi:recombinase family protein [Streptomyces sp. NPDC001680]